MPGKTPSSAALALAEKYNEISSKHNDHIDEIEELHDAVEEDVVPAVLQELALSEDAQAFKSVRAFLDDRSSLFRFYRRSRYSSQNALSLLTSTLTWRVRTDLDSLSLSSLHPLYVSPPSRPPLFWCNTACKDRLGRPTGVISLRSLERVVQDDGSTGLDECREYIVGCMESVRRYLSHMYGKDTIDSRVIDLEKPRAESKPLQMVIIFSLQSSGMANLELELLPFLLDLLKNHFPGMVGAVYIIHYGWVHSGMWGLAKRVLPQQALAKIFFPNEKELPDHFDLSHLPSCLGGEWDITLNDDSNNVMKRFARPGLQGYLYNPRTSAAAAEEGGEWESSSAPPSPRGLSGTSSPAHGRSSRGMSRSGSFDSMVDEFYSTENTPWHLTPRASQTPTPHLELSHYSFGSTQEGTSSSSMLHMTPKAAKKLHQLQMTRGVGMSRSRTVSDANKRSATEDIIQGQSPTISRGTSPNRTRRRTLTIAPGARNVHFQGSTGEAATGGKGEPLSRKGSLRDFRLLQGQFAMSEVGGGESSGSEESDKSGKVGEIKGNEEEQSSTKLDGFFARWRKNSRKEETSVDEGGKKVDAQKGENNAETGGEDGDSLVEMEPDPIPSPKLQVPDIEEPPLSGFGSLSEASSLLSRRTKKYNSLPGHVSPYNASNPFYGYPAYPVKGGNDAIRRSSVFSPSQHDRNSHRLHFRKRKRDLLRTLMYLFVLRLLSMHRGVRNQALAAYRGFVRAIRVGGESEHKGQEEEWREANLRYEKLKMASLRNDDGSYRNLNEDRQELQQQQQQRRARQAQPLVQLGFRKRYAFFLLFLFIIARRDWRSRIYTNIQGVFAMIGLGKLGAEDVGQGKDLLEGEAGETEGLGLGLEDEIPTATASLTGFHLRKKLGWK